MMNPQKAQTKRQSKIARKQSRKLPSLTWQEVDLLTPYSSDKELWGVVVRYTGHPILIDWLASFIQAEGIPERNPKALAKALQRYSIENIKYFREYPERFASPFRTLLWKLGDCDDKTSFLAASLRSFRIPVKLKFITFHFIVDGKVKKKRHVLPFVYIEGKWWPLESVTDIPFGFDPELLAKKKGIKTTSYFIGDDETN